MRAFFDRIVLWLMGTAFAVPFALLSFTRRERATHENGIAARGSLRIVDSPQFPDHDFFRPGREFPCRLRHTTIGFMDDAVLEVRSASIKFADTEYKSPLDLEMNSGEFPPTPNAWRFWQFAVATAKGRYTEYAKYFEQFPRGLEPAQTGVRRNPDSFSQIYYYTQTVFHFKGRDGKTRYVKYRLIPSDRGEDGGLHDEKGVWNQKRLPGESRPKDYLRQEYRERVARGAAAYILQLQLHEWNDGDTEEVFAPDRRWEPGTHPWMDLAILTIREMLPYETGQRLVFSIAQQPPSLGIIAAKSIHDYNSLNYLRVRSAPAKKARMLAYKLFGIPPEDARLGGGTLEDLSGNGSRSSEADPAVKAPVTALKPGDLNRRYRSLSDEQRRHVTELVDRLSAEAGAPARGKTLTHRVTGRLVFEFKTPEGEDKPLHHMPLELWDRDPGNPDDFLARGVTDRDGCFELWYDPADAGRGDLPDLELRVFETHHTYHNDGRLELTPKLVHIIRGGDNVTEQSYDFGVCRVPYWEYDPAAITPRVLIPEQGDPPQAYPPGRVATMLAKIAPLELVKRKHLLAHKLNPGSPSLAEIQDDYPENLTRRLERECPGHTRSDEFFGERILNGMSASILNRDPQHPDRYWLYHHWNSYEQDGVHALPNADARFEVRNGRLCPVQITLFMRAPGATEPNAPTTAMTFTPADGERWLQAKRVVRVSAALSAELDAHLVSTHLNIEQYALAAYRNLRLNPLRFLLFPHLRETVLINHSANTFLIGENGHITRAAGLTAASIDRRIRETMGTLDWKDWRPRRPLTPTHAYAHAAGLYWEALTEYVDGFFEKHRSDIAAHWVEIRRFSSELVEHSVPFFSCDYLGGRLNGANGNGAAWFASEERAGQATRRRSLDGEAKAIHPITLSDTPGDADMENMKQVCRYILMHATFMHTWPNSRQYDDGGEVLYNCLGLRNGPDGVLSPESDLAIAPDPVIATEQLWISYFLSNSGFGYIMKNEDRDLHPDLLAALRKRKDRFAEYGVDIEAIQSRINI